MRNFDVRRSPGQNIDFQSIGAAKKKLRISEIPCDEPARIGGERKLQIIRWGAAYYYWSVYRNMSCRTVFQTVRIELTKARTD